MYTTRFVLTCILLITSALPRLVYADELKDPATQSLSHPDETGHFYQSRQEREAKDKEFKAKFIQEESMSFEEKVMEYIPHAHKMKYAWSIIDGDVDLYFTGLRADRGNKGITYKTNYIPLVGEVDGLELKFEAGDDTQFSFKSEKLPFIDRIDGLSIKGTVGSDSYIAARYTIALN